ncbi:hypothetical protein [Limnohabitans sp. Rim8]|uniref:hypothetical protein n=1 Tax=Limnohabitans sp. Rim8 TaxID=1100718 RepID=UPI00260C9E8A|nr:hypothetical protein [Limnohabitans sp. Rim8]
MPFEKILIALIRNTKSIKALFFTIIFLLNANCYAQYILDDSLIVGDKIEGVVKIKDNSSNNAKILMIPLPDGQWNIRKIERQKASFFIKENSIIYLDKIENNYVLESITIDVKLTNSPNYCKLYENATYLNLVSRHSNISDNASDCQALQFSKSLNSTNRLANEFKKAWTKSGIDWTDEQYILTHIYNRIQNNQIIILYSAYISKHSIAKDWDSTEQNSKLRKWANIYYQTMIAAITNDSKSLEKISSLSHQIDSRFKDHLKLVESAAVALSLNTESIDQKLNFNNNPSVKPDSLTTNSNENYSVPLQTSPSSTAKIDAFTLHVPSNITELVSPNPQVLSIDISTLKKQQNEAEKGGVNIKSSRLHQGLANDDLNKHINSSRMNPSTNSMQGFSSKEISTTTHVEQSIRTNADKSISENKSVNQHRQSIPQDSKEKYQQQVDATEAIMQSGKIYHCLPGYILALHQNKINFAEKWKLRVNKQEKIPEKFNGRNNDELVITEACYENERAQYWWDSNVKITSKGYHTSLTSCGDKIVFVESDTNNKGRPTLFLKSPGRNAEVLRATCFPVNQCENLPPGPFVNYVASKSLCHKR